MGHAIDWDKLVEERNAWVAYNFPDPDGNRTPLDSVLGCIEEMGELIHHHLKQVQEIRGDTDFHDSEMRDAVGDLTVYLLGVMSYCKVRPVLVGTTKLLDADRVLLMLTRRVGFLADYQLHPQNLRTKTLVGPAVANIVSALTMFCETKGWDYGQIVHDTWDRVKQRDWIRYPDTGVPA